MFFKESELILNDDGSIYHLNLLPEHLADTVITVGDPDRVDHVSSYFESIDFKIHKREFKTHTGVFNGHRISVISTGIGTDNIDIVLNELDALVNIDFKTRSVKQNLKSLKIIRIGTSGAIQPNIPVDSYIASELAIGFDNLLPFYDSKNINDVDFSNAVMEQTDWNSEKANPYVIKSDESLLKLFCKDNAISKGITATNVGFYGPQGRQLRIPLSDSLLNDKLIQFNFNGQRITNLEMETSGIYGLSRLLGHKSISLNAILANRATKTFSKSPNETVDNLIQLVLNILTKNGKD